MKENENKKKEPEVDYEKLYYQAMKENVLMKDKKISIELTSIEIDFLKSVMYEELYEIKDRAYFAMDNEDGEDNEAMKNLKPRKDVVLNSMVDEKRSMMETIVKKLRFEI
jgi:hypothetical protein